MNGTEITRVSGNFSTAYICTWALLGKSTEKNESYIRLYGYFYYPGSGTVGSSGSGFTGFYLDGTYISSGSYRYGNGYHLLGQKDITVKHNDDGVFPGRSVGISAYSYHMNASNTGTIGYGAVATIPRATACPNLDGYIESSAPISLNPAVGTFKHRLYYSYNGKTGYYPSSTGFFGNTGSLNLDESFYDKTPKSTGTGNLTLYTYSSDGTYIGEKTGTLTARCDKSKCGPSVNADIIDINEVTSKLTSGGTTSNIIIKGYSTAQITYTFTTRKGATIASKMINGVEATDNPMVIPNVDTNTFALYIKDSRGFEERLEIINQALDYVPLRLNFNAFRPNPTASEIKINFTGSYFDGLFGKVANTLNLSWKYKLKDATEWTNGGTFTKDTHYKISDNKFYSGNGSSASDISLSATLFPYNKSYDIGIFFADKLVDTYTTKPVPKGKPIVNWADDLFNVNGEFTINDKTFLDKVYPIGSIYMSINATSPAELLGGTWEQLKDRFLLGAGNTYANGTTGGEANTTLNANQMPSHTHSGTTGGSGGHSHTMPFKGFGNVTTTTNGWFFGRRNVSGDGNDGWWDATSWVNNHTHDFTTSSAGGGQAHNNMPPYLTVYMWKRIS